MLQPRALRNFLHPGASNRRYRHGTGECRSEYPQGPFFADGVVQAQEQIDLLELAFLLSRILSGCYQVTRRQHTLP